MFFGHGIILYIIRQEHIYIYINSVCAKHHHALFAYHSITYMKLSVTSLHQCIIATYQIIAWHHITSHHITFFTACTTIYVYLCSSLNVLHLHGTHRVHLISLPFIPHSFQTCCRQRLTWWQRPIPKSHAQIPWPRISSAPKLLQLLMPLCPMLTWTRHAN